MTYDHKDKKKESSFALYKWKKHNLRDSEEEIIAFRKGFGAGYNSGRSYEKKRLPIIILKAKEFQEKAKFKRLLKSRDATAKRCKDRVYKVKEKV